MFLKESDKLALVDFDNSEITYKKLINNIKYYSKTALNELEKNRFAIICMENRVEWIYSFFAIWDRQATAIAVDALSNAKELSYFINDSKPQVVICSNNTEETIKEAIKQIEMSDSIKLVNVDKHKIDESKFDNIDMNYNLNVPDGEDVAVMLYTSGTTGDPKGVMLTYNNINAEIDGIMDLGVIENDEQILAFLPFHHILPLAITVLLILREQLSLVFVEKLASKEIFEALEKNRVTALVGVPRVFKLFYDGIKQQIDSKWITRMIFKIMSKVKSMKLRRIVFSKVHKKFGGHLKMIVSGGAKLEKYLGDFYETLGIFAIEGYGLTETSPVVSANSILNRKTGTVGKKFFNAELKTVDGELWVKGPLVMKGYYNKPEKTKEVITDDGWFKTGDLAEIDKNGYVTILGRKNTMIVMSNGKNIDPETLETRLILQSNYLIKEAGIFNYNDKLVAIVVPDLTECRKQGVTNIKAYIKNIVENYNLEAHNYEKILDYKVFEEELPKTRVGKVRRFMLPDFYNRTTVKKEVEKEPESNVYKQLKEYIVKNKGVEPTPSENLELELGMDSLDLVEFFAYIDNSFGVKLNEEQFSNMSNLKALYQYIEEKAVKYEDGTVDWSQIVDKAKPIENKSIIATKIVYPILYIFVTLYFRLKKVNKEKIEDKPQIFISNHQSFIDGLVLGTLFPKKMMYNTYYLAIDWYFKGILKVFVDHGNIVLVDINKDITKSIEEIAGYIKAGKNVLIFPEGSRTKDGKIADFKKVFAIVAKELNVDVQCLGVKGAFEAYSRHMKLPRPKKIEVAVLDKIKPEGSYEDIVKKAETIIKSYVEK